MIALTVKWDVKPEYADDFLDLIADFNETCRSEPGCLRFEWSRSVDNAHQYVLIEVYAGPAAALAHVTSGHFMEAWNLQRTYAARLPRLISIELPRSRKQLSAIEMPPS